MTTPARMHRKVAFVTLVALAGVTPPAPAQPPEPPPLQSAVAPPTKAPAGPFKGVQPISPPATSPTVPPSEPATAAPTTPALRPGQVLLNFQGADIQAVVKAMSQMTGRNFLLDPRVKGQITIISAKPVSTAAAYQIFLSALKAQGFTAVEGIGVVKIVPVAEAKMSAEVSMLPSPRGGEQVMTQVLIVQHTSAAQMIPLLRPLMSPTSQLSSYEPANALIITDYADNIRRLLRIIDKIDQPVSSDVTVIPLTHASALDVAELITRLSLPGTGQVVPGAPVPVGGGAGDRFTIVPDLRTNSLLIRADNPGRVNQLRSLIATLDVPAVQGGQTHVVYLKNADAVKLAEVLRGLLAGEARSQSPTPAVPTQAMGVPLAAAAGAKTAEASLIQADEATNALVINASDAVYNNLRAVIEKLDVRRAQVYVEALIVEMSADKANELGFQWAGAEARGAGTLAGVQNFSAANPGLTAAVASPSTAFATSSGLMLAYLGKTITLPDGTVIHSLGALARALEQKNLANVLSTPNLMTLDNAEAKIMVGQNVPFVTGSYAQAAGVAGAAVNPFQTIERKDVGLTLKIKPQVSEGGLVKLDIYQEVSSISPTTVTGASDLITNKRTIETRVLVDDGQTIALGGLIEDNTQQTQQAVPILGSIPVLGALFRYRQTTDTKTNLMVFLRPVIIHSPEDGYALTSDRYRYIRAQAQEEMERPELMDKFAPTPPKPKEPEHEEKTRDKAGTGNNAPASRPNAAAPGNAAP